MFKIGRKGTENIRNIQLFRQFFWSDKKNVLSLHPLFSLHVRTHVQENMY
jgi:hypothetical protein